MSLAGSFRDGRDRVQRCGLRPLSLYFCFSRRLEIGCWDGLLDRKIQNFKFSFLFSYLQVNHPFVCENNVTMPSKKSSVPHSCSPHSFFILLNVLSHSLSEKRQPRSSRNRLVNDPLKPVSKRYSVNPNHSAKNQKRNP